MARSRQRTKRIFVSVLVSIALLLVAGMVAAYAYIGYVNRAFREKIDREDPRLVAKLQEDARKPGEPFYMLLIGEDRRPGEVRARSDTLIIARVDPPAKRLTLLSIPRDTRVPIPGYGKNKINAAMTLGGPSLVVDTVKDLTGLPISHYLEVDFNGFRGIVNALGGVWVDVPHNINDIRAANHVESARVVKKGYQRLDGDHALTFVRSRKLLGDDFTRIKDQQIFLKALAKQSLDIKNVARFPGIVQATMKCVTTDLDVGEMMNLITDFKGMDADHAMETVTAPGEPKYLNGGWYVISDEDKLAALIDKMEAGESVESTSTSARNASSRVRPSSVSVTVRNGAGIRGLGAEVGQILTKGGFPVAEVGNTARPVYDKTIIIFKSGKDEDAKLVQDTLGSGQAVHGSDIYKFDTDVLVIVGKDWPRQGVSRPNNAGVQ
jgi:LCP family protein required for cell wall assembly